MFKKINKLLLVLWVTNLLFLQFGTAFALDFKKFFPYELGNKWEYQLKFGSRGEDISEWEVSFSEKEKFILCKDPQGDETYFFDKEGLKLSKSVIDTESLDYVVYSPSLIIIPADINLNQKMTTSGTMEVYDKSAHLIDSGKYTRGIEFHGEEEINVPAGNFTDCLKFIYSTNLEMSNGDFRNRVETRWYAPKVGVVKSIESDIFIPSATGEKSETCEEAMFLKGAILGKKQIGKIAK